MSITNAFTIDVEDGISIAMRDHFNIQMDPTERVKTNTEIILSLLESHQVKATFFILGEVARKYPELVKKISRQGHEIGAHGYSHKQYYLLPPEDVKQEVFTTKALLEDITGRSVFGHRAPAFSIMPTTAWALSIIEEVGFIYDSSIMPIRTSHYGWPGIRRDIHALLLPDDRKLIEVPLSVVNILGKTIPACGGGYLRYFPYGFTRKAFQIIQSQRPVIVYLHPYELDIAKYPDYFYAAQDSLSFSKRLPIKLFRLNKGTVKRKLNSLLKEFHFGPMIEIINEQKEFSGIPTSSL